MGKAATTTGRARFKAVSASTVALGFRAIFHSSVRHVPDTRGGRSVGRVAPKHAATGPDRHYWRIDALAPRRTTGGPQ